MLRFEYDAAIRATGVELQARLVGVDLQHDAVGRLVKLNRRLARGTAQHEIVVELRRNRLCRPEIEGRALDRGNLTRRNQRRIDRRIIIGIDFQQMRAREPFPAAMEVEPGMQGRIEDGRGIRHGGILQDEFVFIGQRTEHGYFQIARIAFLTVGRDAGHQQGFF